MTTPSNKNAGSSRPGRHQNSQSSGNDVRDRLTEAQETVTTVASEAAETARETALETAEGAKDEVAGSVRDFASAINKASSELGARNQSAAAGLVREAASGLETIARSVEGSSVRDLSRSVAEFGRRQPVAFLSAAVLLGVGLGRFARATSDDQIPSQSPYKNSLGTGPEDTPGTVTPTSVHSPVSDPTSRS